MKKGYLLLASLLLLVGIVSAQPKKEDKLRAVELTYFSDLMVAGTITNAKGLNFEVKIDEVLKGENPGENLSIPKYKNIGTAKRFNKYKEDQQVLLFLEKDGDKYKIMGKGGEGEQLIDGADAYLDSRTTGILNRIAYHTIDGSRFYAEKLNKTDLLDALKGFSPLYKLDYLEVVPRKNGQDMKSETYMHLTCEQVGTDEEVYQFSLKSDIHEKLVTMASRLIQDNPTEE